MGGKRNVQRDTKSVGFGFACFLCVISLAVIGLATYDGQLFPWPNIGGIVLLITTIALFGGDDD